MKDIIVIGGGGHGKVLISILKKIENYNIVGYVDFENRGNILGVSYYGTDEKLLSLKDKPLLALGIGQIKNIAIRKKIVDKFFNNAFSFETIISPNAIINEEVELGEGTVVMDGVVINSGTNIGKYSIVNTNSSVDHDCKIGDFVHIAPGCTLSGEVKLEQNVLVGTGAKIIQGIRIVENVIIAGGSCVMEHIVEKGTFIGVPARKLSKKMFKKKR
ncbi:MAG: NeuD/PglB/VioB family sugar acetyltransferase [Candidatus Cloacimonetes bacterium]|nr:NeuD/PglB/VioB family sugar acetyltransferase [Candidatus Cloacimonadota bacterium]